METKQITQLWDCTLIFLGNLFYHCFAGCTDDAQVGYKQSYCFAAFNTHLTIITIRNEHCIRPHYLAYNKAQNEKRKAAKLKAKQATGN